MNRAFSPIAVALAISMGFVAIAPAVAQQSPAEPAPQDSPQPAPRSSPAPSTTKPSVINSVQYQCDGGKGFSAVYLSNNTVRATFGSKKLTLPQVVSGSGIRYSDGSVTLNAKGDEAFVEVGDKVLFKNCLAKQTPEGQTVEGRW